MYMFDRNGNEVKLGDWVYFNPSIDSNSPLEDIGEISWFDGNDVDFIVVKSLTNHTNYRRGLIELRKVPDTVATLLMFERDMR